MRLFTPTVMMLSFERRKHKAFSIYDLSRSSQSQLIVILFLTLVLVLVGCRRSTPISLVPVSYEDLCGLGSEQMGTMNEEDTRQWIKEKYGSVQAVILDTLLDDSYKGSIVAYGWGEEGGQFVIAYLRDGHLFRISLRDVEDGPRLGQVVAGLGPPQMIDRYMGLIHNPLLYAIGLDYPALGISMMTSNVGKLEELEHEGKLMAPLTEDMQVDSIECYVPGSMEEVLHEIFFLPPETASYQMQRRMPWPGFGTLIPLEY